MKVCFNRFVKICPAKKCHIQYEMYGNNGHECPEGLKYDEREIPDVTRTAGIEYMLKKEYVKKN
jgi:CxxC motif-containing protein